MSYPGTTGGDSGNKRCWILRARDSSLSMRCFSMVSRCICAFSRAMAMWPESLVRNPMSSAVNLPFCAFRSCSTPTISPE